MNFFLVLSGKKLKKAIFIIVAFLFVAGVIYSERQHISVFPYADEPAAIYSVVTDKKVVALTFDISWGEKRALPILDVLQKEGVRKATFFLSSPWSQKHPEIVQKIVEAGYEIGSHGHKHDDYSRLSDDEIRREIRTADRILTEITGKKPSLIRMPNGDFDKRVLNIAHQLGYQVIQWDTDSLDWMNIGVDQIVERVLANAHPGDIILMHASDSAKQTHQALPRIIDGLRDKGYTFVTVTELLHMTELRDSEVKDSISQMDWN